MLVRSFCCSIHWRSIRKVVTSAIPNFSNLRLKAVLVDNVLSNERLQQTEYRALEIHKWIKICKDVCSRQRSRWGEKIFRRREMLGTEAILLTRLGSQSYEDMSSLLNPSNLRSLPKTEANFHTCRSFAIGIERNEMSIAVPHTTVRLELQTEWGATRNHERAAFRQFNSKRRLVQLCCRKCGVSLTSPICAYMDQIDPSWDFARFTITRCDMIGWYIQLLEGTSLEANLKDSTPITVFDERWRILKYFALRKDSLAQEWMFCEGVSSENQKTNVFPALNTITYSADQLRWFSTTFLDIQIPQAWCDKGSGKSCTRGRLVDWQDIGGMDMAVSNFKLRLSR